MFNQIKLLIEKGQFPAKMTWLTLVKRTIQHDSHRGIESAFTINSSDHRIFIVCHSSITPIKVWKLTNTFYDIQFIMFVEKLWTIHNIQNTDLRSLANYVY